MANFTWKDYLDATVERLPQGQGIAGGIVDYLEKEQQEAKSRAEQVINTREHPDSFQLESSQSSKQGLQSNFKPLDLGAKIETSKEYEEMDNLSLSDPVAFIGRYNSPREWLMEQDEAERIKTFSTGANLEVGTGEKIEYGLGNVAVGVEQTVPRLAQIGTGLLKGIKKLTFPNSSDTAIDRLYNSLAQTNARKAEEREEILQNVAPDSDTVKWSSAIGELGLALLTSGIGASAGAAKGAAGVSKVATQTAKGVAKSPSVIRRAESIAKASGARTGQRIATIGYTFPQEAGSTAVDKVRSYIAQTGDTELKDYNPLGDTLTSVAVGTINSAIETGFGVERYIPEFWGTRNVAGRTARRFIEGGLGEGAEEFLQSVVTDLGDILNGYRDDVDWNAALDSALIGGVLGGSAGVGMYHLNRARLARKLSNDYNLPFEDATKIVDSMLTNGIEQTTNELSARTELVNNKGQAWDKLVSGVKTAMETVDFADETSRNNQAEQFAKTNSMIAIREAQKAGLSTDEFLDVAEFANMNNGQNLNMIFVKPLGTIEEIDTKIKEKDAIINREKELKKTGAGDNTILTDARRQKAILEKAKAIKEFNNKRYQEQIQAQTTPETAQEIETANQDVKNIKGKTQVEFESKADNQNLTSAQKTKRYGNAVLKSILPNKLDFDAVMVDPIYANAKQALIAVADRLNSFMKAHKAFGLKTDIANALKKMQTINPTNFIDSIRNPIGDGVDVIAENAFLYNFMFGDATTIQTFMDSYITRAEESLNGNTRELSKKDLVGQAFKATDNAMQTQAQVIGAEYTSIYNEDGSYADKNVMAVMLSYQNQFVQEQPVLNQVDYVDITEDFNSYSKDTKATVREYIKSLVGEIFDTSTSPLQIQITSENKLHIIKPKKMGKATTKRHLAALKQIENIISKAIKTGESDVDLTHNTNKKTLKHKQKVDKYIYFNTQVLINGQIYNVKLSAEQIKGQDPNLLDLYDVNVKKEPDTNIVSKSGPSGSYSTTILEQNDIVNQDFRDGHRAPSYDGTPVEQRLDEGGDFSLEEVAKGQHNQPSDYFSPVGARMYGYDTLPGRQSETAINNIIRGLKAGKTDLTITAYRAVPADLPLDVLINGDWVSFSEQYVIDHGESRFGEGNYKIIKQEVPIQDVWWDGNDINEWGYDNSWRPSVLAQGKKANGFYDPELGVIVLGRNMNEMTLPHEMQHYWLDKIFSIYKRAKSGELQVRDEWMTETKALFDMLGIDENQTQLTQGQQEKFARMSEAYLTGIGVTGDMNATFKEYQQWVPEKYKSILNLGYLSDDGKIEYPFLDQGAVDFFNKWYANYSLPSLATSPERQEFINPEGENGEVLPVSIKEMNNRDKEFGVDAEEQVKTDQRLYNTLDENMPAEIKVEADGQKVVQASRSNFLKESEKQQRRWFERKSRDTEAQLAQDYIEKNPEHAKEVIFGDPELIPNDTGIDRATLINAYMALNNITPESEDWATLHTNIAINQSLAGTQLALSNNTSYRTYLDALREIENAREMKAATNYAGAKQGALERFNRDIQRFVDEELPKVLATAPNTEARDIALKSLFERARTKFSGNTTGSVLNQMDFDYARGQKGASAAFTRWAVNQIKKDAGAKLNGQEQAKLLNLSAKAQQAVIDLDDRDAGKAVAGAQEIRKWQVEKDKLMGVKPQKFSLFGDYAPRAMLASFNTLVVSNIPSTAMNTAVVRMLERGSFGKNEVSKSLADSEIKRIKAIYGATAINLAQMEKPTSPSLLHGEKYSSSGQKWYDPFTILGKEDNWFRVPTFVNTLARIATQDAIATKRSPDEVFKEYCRLENQSDEAKLARKQALSVANMAVFTQDGALARSLNEIRSWLNKGSRALLGLDPNGFGLGNLLSPFLKTGANIAEMGIRGSIAPITELTARLQSWRSGKAIDPMKRLALNMDWTYFVFSSVIVALLSALTSDDDEFYTEPYEMGKTYDPDKPYDSINITGVWIDLDFFGPFAIPIRTGCRLVKQWRTDNLSAIYKGYGQGLKYAAMDTPLLQEVFNNQMSYAAKKPEDWATGLAYNQVNKLIPSEIKPLSRAISRGTGAQFDTGLGKIVERKFHRNYGWDGAELTTQDLIDIFSTKFTYQPKGD